MKTTTHRCLIIAIVAIMAAHISAYAQTGISISPPRIYYVIGPGQSQTEKVSVSNPSKDYNLELGISFEDWEYNTAGNNIMYPAGTLSSSCASWISLPESFFSLAPGESKDIDVQMTMPAGYQNDSVPVHTAMLYVTQLNPRDGVDKTGANIRIAVRTGIKLYQRLPGKYSPNLEISNFLYQQGTEHGLILSFDNTGDVWTDGRISLELLNQSTGKKIVVPDILFYSMPGNKRQQFLALPDNLEAARYIGTAIVNYGDANTVKIAELEFSHEK